MNEGSAFVYHGSATGLSTTHDWTVDPADPLKGGSFAISVSNAGDVNNDGFDDVIVGHASYKNNSLAEQGRALVYHGSSTGLSTTEDWSYESNQHLAQLGLSVSTAGDVNNDGFDDVIVGAWLFDNGETNEGRAFVFHGSSTGLSLTADWTAEGDQVGAFFGISVSTAGDVNNDGYADVIVGAHWYDNGETDEGRVYVFHGSTTGLSATADWTAEIDQASSQFGRAVASAGDVNGDGYSDVIVGADFYDNGEADEGGAFLYLGSASGLSLTADWSDESDQADARYGNTVASAGDVDNDGLDDVIIGASYYNETEPDAGKAYVYFGTAGGDTSPADPTELGQFRADETTSIGVGGGTNDATTVLKGKVFNPGDTIKLQVEVRAIGTPFTDTFTDESALLASGTIASITLSGLADGGYHWQARAVDAADQVSAWVPFGGNAEAEADFEVDTVAPAGFTRIEPGDGSSTTDNTPFFDWTDSSDANGVTYQILVDDSGAGFPSPEIDTAGLTASEFTPTSGLADGTYSWKVIASDPAGNTAETLVGTVTIDATPPASFTKITPADGSFTSNTTPLFDWNDSSDAGGVTYQILVDDSGSGFPSPEIDVSGLTPSEFTPGGALGEGTYSWKVIASDTLNNTTETAVWTFTIDTTSPAGFARLVPVDSTTTTDGTPLFDWEDSSDANGVTYQLLADDSGAGFPSPEIDTSGLTASEFTPGSALANGTYSWKVVATDPAGNSVETTVGSFTINATPPSSFTKITPTDGSFTIETTPLFDWTDSSAAGGVTYRILVDDSGDGFPTPEIDEAGLAASEFTPTGDLADATYSWKVIASDPFGNAVETEVWSFTIDTTPPVITAISATPDGGTAPQRVRFAATVTDDTGSGVAFYQWDFDGNGVIEFTSVTSPNVTWSYAVPGSFDATLKVIDLLGNSATDSVTITVDAPTGLGASLDVAPVSGEVPLIVEFEVVDFGSNTVAYEWDFNGDGNFDRVTAEPLTTQTYLQVGSFDPIVRSVLRSGRVKLLVGATITTLPPGVPAPTTALITRVYFEEDGDSAFDPAVDPVVDEDLALGLDGNTYFVRVGQRLGVQGLGETGSTVVQWSLDFEGDGDAEIIGTGTDPIEGIFTYRSPGSYPVKLRIEYADGSGIPLVAIESSITIEVVAPTLSTPSAWLVYPATGLSIHGDRVTFEIRALPAQVMDVSTMQLQAFDGIDWVDLSAHVTSLTGVAEARILRLDVIAAIDDGLLTVGVQTPFRVQVTTEDSTVVISAEDPGLPQTDLQGPVLLTPGSGAALHEAMTGQNVVMRLELEAGKAIDARVGNEVRVRLSAAGVPPDAETLEIRILHPFQVQPAPVGHRIRRIYRITLHNAAGQRIAPDENPTIESGPFESGPFGNPAILNLQGGLWIRIQDQGFHRIDRLTWGTTSRLGTFATTDPAVTRIRHRRRLFQLLCGTSGSLMSSSAEGALAVVWLALGIVALLRLRRRPMIR